MGRGSGSIRPHLAVLLLLTGVLAGLLLRTPVPSVPTPLPQGCLLYTSDAADE